MSRVCEHCGSDTYKAEQFDRMRDREYTMRRRIETLAREKGLLDAQLRFADADFADARASLQRKIERQGRVIRRLEKRWAERKALPLTAVNLAQQTLDALNWSEDALPEVVEEARTRLRGLAENVKALYARDGLRAEHGPHFDVPPSEASPVEQS